MKSWRQYGVFFVSFKTEMAPYNFLQEYAVFYKEFISMITFYFQT